MVELSQSEYARAVRGIPVTPGAPPQTPPLLLGLSAVARTAVRRVHTESPDVAVAYFNRRVAKWRAAGPRAAGTTNAFGRRLDQYVEWDRLAGLPVDRVDVCSTVPVGRSTWVRATAHVVGLEGDGHARPRVVIWDTEPCDSVTAALVALPALEATVRLVDPHIEVIDVWQLGTGCQYAVSASAARARAQEAEFRVLRSVMG